MDNYKFNHLCDCFGFAAFCSLNFLTKRTGESNEIITSTSSSTSQTNSTSEDQNLAIYKVNEGNLFFQFLYPKDLKLVEREVQFELVHNTDLYLLPISQLTSEISVSIFNNALDLSLEQWLEAHVNGSQNFHGIDPEQVVPVIDKLKDKRQVVINGINSLMVTDDVEPYSSVRIIFSLDGFIINIAYVDFAQGEIKEPFAIVMSSLTSGKKNPKINMDIYLEIESLIQDINN